MGERLVGERLVGERFARERDLDADPAVLAPAPRLPAGTTVLRPSRHAFARIRALAAPAALVASDAALAVALGLLALWLRDRALPGLMGLEPFHAARPYVNLLPTVALLLAVRFAFGLYPGYGLNPTEELRRQTTATTVFGLFLVTGAAFFRLSADYSRVVGLLAVALFLLCLPVARAGTKALLIRAELFGTATWVVGRSARGRRWEAVLRAAPYLGLNVIGSSPSEPPHEVACRYCVLIPDEIDDVGTVLDSLNARFRRVWLMPNLLDVASVWITARDVEGHLALELRNHLLEPGTRLLKRFIDGCFVLLLSPVVVPLSLLLALLITLDSPGPVFFTHTRIGRNGRPFSIVKFRTMRRDAAERLQAVLSADAAANDEWLRTRKLRRDPRVTRVGRILRRFSLDELPQLWNVVRGEMSLVGPRAITRSELPMYGRRKDLYLTVVPGITGVWQTSGRSRLSTDERVTLDAYYVRNWSIWLDVVVIARTVGAVLRGDGAY